MAIRPKKRDRFSMSSLPSYSSHPTSHPANPSSVADEQAEYERAVAFLAEFRSRRVASAVLHSTSLDAIVEADGLDETLASDFSLALKVGRSPGLRRRGSGLSGPGLRKAATTKSLLDLDASSSSNGHRPAPPGLHRKGLGLSRTRGPPGMRRAATTKCLLDLDVAPPSDGHPVTRPVTPPMSEPDCYFGRYWEGGPATKRRRSLLGR